MVILQVKERNGDVTYVNLGRQVRWSVSDNKLLFRYDEDFFSFPFAEGYNDTVRQRLFVALDGATQPRSLHVPLVIAKLDLSDL